MQLIYLKCTPLLVNLDPFCQLKIMNRLIILPNVVDGNSKVSIIFIFILYLEKVTKN